MSNLLPGQMTATAGSYLCPKCGGKILIGNTGYSCGCVTDPPSPAELVALCKAHLTENGWTGESAAGGWRHPERQRRDEWLTLGEALDAQFRRDGVL